MHNLISLFFWRYLLILALWDSLLTSYFICSLLLSRFMFLYFPFLILPSIPSGYSQIYLHSLFYIKERFVCRFSPSFIFGIMSIPQFFICMIAVLAFNFELPVKSSCSIPIPIWFHSARFKAIYFDALKNHNLNFQDNHVPFCRFWHPLNFVSSCHSIRFAYFLLLSVDSMYCCYLLKVVTPSVL